jgi:selenide,water dikinase
MTPLVPLTRDLVLVGGGHAHALVLRMWGMNPLPGVRLTVINPGPVAPYSGMLPGHVAGHYTRDELEIDLVKLCRFAGARLVLGSAVGIDRAARVVKVKGRPDVGYDVASVDIGIHGELPEIAGFAAHGVAAKPLDRFAARWQAFRASVARAELPPQVAVIGGGIAGAELALAMDHALRADGAQPEVSVIEAQGSLTGATPAALTRLRAEMARAGISVVTSARVAEVAEREVLLQDGQRVAAALTVASAGAKPHGWVLQTDLPLQDGFIRVGPTLQVEGDPALFAAGDCCHMGFAPRPKAGVFAVRAAPVLYRNLRSAMAGGKMRAFRPQKRYLKLISLGRQAAIADRGRVAVAGEALWRWKDRIDRKFMEKFQDLPAMAMPAPAEAALGVAEMLADKPLCAGCGAKVGPGALEDALCALPPVRRADVLSAPGDDAAVLAHGKERQVVTVDHLRAFDDDLYRMARIATVHALGDVWAMGASPQAVLVSLVIPRQRQALQRRSLAEIMAGVRAVTDPVGAEIVGGHTSMGAEMTIGLTVTGLVDQPITVAGARPGDALILTAPIGSGTLLAAEMAGAARGRDIAALLQEMQRPQADAAQVLRHAHAMTDVTGFGLAGHLWNICKASGVGADVELAAIPLFDGAADLSRQGHRSSLFKDNAAIAERFEGLSGVGGDLLFDPQTAGGLLAAVDADSVPEVLSRLRDGGYTAAQIGRITDEVGRIRCR